MGRCSVPSELATCGLFDEHPFTYKTRSVVSYRLFTEGCSVDDHQRKKKWSDGVGQMKLFL